MNLPWVSFLQFAGAALIIVFAGRGLTGYSNTIAKRRGLGEAWAGLILLAVATSLPELFTSVASIVRAGSPDLAIGDLLGSVLFNLAMIFLLDLIQGPGSLLGRVNLRLILSGGLGILLCGIVIVGLLIRRGGIWQIGLDTTLIFLLYLIGTRLIHRYQGKRRPSSLEPSNGKESSLARAYLGYLLCGLLILGAGIWLAQVGKKIAEETMWGESFIGTIFLAVATSLPEVTTCIAAIRLGLLDMALGNIFGSNIFNLVIIFICDISFRKAPILASASKAHVLTASVGILLTLIAIIGILVRSRKAIGKLGWDSIAIVVIYFLGLYFLFKG